MLRAALFDLDGVIRTFRADHPARVERQAGLPPGTLDRVAFGAPELAAAVGGAITFEDWRDAVAAALRAGFGVDGRAVADDFFAFDAGTVDGEVLAVVREVRRSVRLGLLTNATSRLPSELEALGLTDQFDVVCNSSELGVAKPDPRVFAIAAERVGVRADECFFTDDRSENAEAAAAAGMTAHHYTGVAALRDALRSLLDR